MFTTQDVWYFFDLKQESLEEDKGKVGYN